LYCHTSLPISLVTYTLSPLGLIARPESCSPAITVGVLSGRSAPSGIT
jgi:hypothetical protein